MRVLIVRWRVGARAVALAFDADAAGRHAAKARAALAEAGVQAFSVALPDGADLADLLARVEPQERAETLATALLNSECAPGRPSASAGTVPRAHPPARDCIRAS